MRRAFLLVALLASACREAPAPFAVENPFDADPTGQLTFNARNDHLPVWNEADDSVYYTAESFPGFPPTSGMLLAVPRAGGVAAPILESIQVGRAQQPRLAAASLSAGGDRIAFFELTDVRDREFDYIVCPFDPLAGVIDTAGTHSFLRQAVLRVRNVNSSDVSDAAQLTVNFPGRTGTAPAIVNVAHPFHRLFEFEGLPFFRASWSPDGNRLVFSNGLGLYVWTVGQAAATELPGTEDGILPAWSPDGNWIAFSRPFRGGTQRITCQGWYNGTVRPAAFFDRTIYTPLTRQDAELVITRPDGSEARSLGAGDGPAWAPDSRTIVAHRDRNLYEIAIETGAATPVPNTLNGYEPAISRDGSLLTFSRRTRVGVGDEDNTKGNYDIWVVPF